LKGSGSLKISKIASILVVLKVFLKDSLILLRAKGSSLVKPLAISVLVFLRIFIISFISPIRLLGEI
jgi:hypothetical protein